MVCAVCGEVLVEDEGNEGGEEEEGEHFGGYWEMRESAVKERKRSRFMNEFCLKRQ